MTRSGLRKHRIAIEVPTETRTASGAVSVAWTQYVQRWAAIMPRGGREFYKASQINAELTQLFEIQGMAAITTKMRVTFDGRRFDILAVWSDDGKSPDKAACLYLSCREGNSQGS